jgi:glyoxylase-like metal-dependent hydrolase (beta-lactamase superfamily II)
MKRLHRKDLYAWSVFNERLNIDFNAFAWIRTGAEGGNVLIDPLPLTAHDEAHLRTLGGAAWVVVTNSDHLRGAKEVAAAFGAKIAGPAAEKSAFPLACDRWLAEGDELVPGLFTFELEGSKTPGELALLLEGTTLISGDLIRAHRAGSLMTLLPEQKLKDAKLARASIARIVKRGGIEAVLVGDGWNVFRDGQKLLEELVASLPA